jgi:hypothetical protein
MHLATNTAENTLFDGPLALWLVRKSTEGSFAFEGRRAEELAERHAKACGYPL